MLKLMHIADKKTLIFCENFIVIGFAIFYNAHVILYYILRILISKDQFKDIFLIK